MKYFDTHTLLFAAVLYVLYGTVCGTLYPFRDRVRSVVAAVLYLPRAVYLTARHPSLKTARGQAMACIGGRFPVLRHINDFLYVFLCGIGFLLLTYVALDGVFRVWCLVLYLFPLFVCRYTVGRWLGRAADGILLCLYTAVYYSAGLLASPLVFLLHTAYVHVCRPIFHAVKHRFLRTRSRRIMAKKRKKIRRIFFMQTKSTKRKRETFVPLSIFMHSAKNPLNEAFFLDKNNKK